ncbi:MAG: metallophosphoesterase family protein [Janthinobacterium lividum]
MAPSFPTVRDPLLSLFQSAAAAVARARSAPGDAHPLPAAAAAVAVQRRDPLRGYAPPAHLAMPAGTCAALGLELLEAELCGDAARRQALHDRLAFSQCDPLWAETLLDYARTLQPDGTPRPIPYRRHRSMGDFVVQAAAPALRVALLSDWGTGTAEARAVAGLLAAQRPDAVIHLGDIYFAGTAAECEAHFLQPLRAVLPEAALYSLCGNHDVYSGGEGYYGLLDRIGQPASYFCLRSPDLSWQFLAADTGLHDRDPFDADTALTRLDPGEELWHADKLRGFPGRTVLLSHHQPFSAYAQIGPAAARDPTNPALMASHGRLAAAGRIDAWFWGHEHSLRCYAPYRGVAAGRNIGFGAIPVEAAPGPETPLPDLADPPALAAAIELDVVEGAYTHGFALLDCAADGIEASYWALTRPDGPVHREWLGAGVMGQDVS